MPLSTEDGTHQHSQKIDSHNFGYNDNANNDDIEIECAKPQSLTSIQVCRFSYKGCSSSTSHPSINSIKISSAFLPVKPVLMNSFFKSRNIHVITFPGCLFVSELLPFNHVIVLPLGILRVVQYSMNLCNYLVSTQIDFSSYRPHVSSHECGGFKTDKNHWEDFKRHNPKDQLPCSLEEEDTSSRNARQVNLV